MAKDASMTERIESAALPPPDSSESSSPSADLIPAKTLISTPVSLLIESLVKNICNIYEPNSEKAKATYKFICDTLFQMKLIDESYLMKEFEGMRNQFENAFIHLLNKSINKKNLPLRANWLHNFQNSHYLREFEQVRFIAGGGFGQVFQVRHKLDGTHYAVKIIPIKSQGIEAVRTYLSEVKTFASVNHTNVVQYKAAWLEFDSATVLDPISTEGSSKIRSVDDDFKFKQSLDSFSCREPTSEFEIQFKHSVSKYTLSSRRNSKRNRRDSLSEGAQALCPLSVNEIEKLRLESQSRIKWATLYIQMALCQTTLKQWLEKKNSIEGDGCSKALLPLNTDSLPLSADPRDIFIQLLRGLQYIHSKGIVHHDIKPSNVFVSNDNGSFLVQLGDFGLACPLQNSRHSLALGTRLYAAPEQLSGQCNPQSDMYSLGIVLFELVERFKTDMERVEMIERLKEGQISARALLNEPELAQIITRLVQKAPNDRPGTKELLNIFTQKAEKEEVELLKKQLKQSQDEILRLKELLKLNGISYDN